jgi:branched-chain amino acid transport system substrate-binding protein
MKHGTKKDKGDGVSRRTFMKAAGMAGLAGSMGFPAVLRAAAPKEVLVGSIHSLTGITAEAGITLAQAVQLAMDQKNAAGGIKSMGGAKLRVIQMDSEGKPKVGEAATEKLIRDGCVALLGAYNSPVTMVTTQVAERHGIPHVITVAVAEEILQRGFKFVFRVQPDTDNMAKYSCQFVRLLAQKVNMDLKSMVHIHVDGFGTAIANKVTRYAPQFGFEKIADITYAANVSDLTTEISKIKSLNPDVVFDTGYLSDGILKLRSYNDLKVEPRGGIIGVCNAAYSNPLLIKEIGKTSEYMMDGNYWHNPRSPLAQATIKEYDNKFDKVKFNSQAIHGYNASLVLLDALERAGTVDPARLRDAIAATSLKAHISPGGAIEFDSTGQNKNALTTLQQIQKRDIRLVMPEEYSDAKPVFPIPKWNEKT